jgi:UDP-N-acetylmuramate dehydrogenase
MSHLPALIKENVSLAPLTYYKIGGPARYFTIPENTADLATIAAFLKSEKQPYFVLGAGSNVLFHDDGFDGLVIHTGKLDRTLEEANDQSPTPSQVLVRVGCSVMVSRFLRHCCLMGWGGLEFLVGVPGNMGGVFCMNAGTKTGEISGVVQNVSVFNLSTLTSSTYESSQIQYSYRTQRYLKPHDIVLQGTVRVQLADKAKTAAQIQELLSKRKASQPIDMPSCGSVFKNPDSGPRPHAWQLIADAGLRGKAIGDAQVSEMHTNFIVNRGKARAEHVVALIEEIKAEVKKRFGVLLVEEVKIVEQKGTQFLV